LDYWRVIGRSQDACLATVLKFSSDLHELMSRMRDELGVMWEFTSRASLLRAHDAFSASLLTQLGGVAAQGMVDQIVDGVFSKIGLVAESLATQIDRILFEKSGIRSERFDRLIAELKRPSSALLQQLWQGEDSHLQRVLLRNHADERVWPFFKLWEDILQEISTHGNSMHVEFIKSLGRQLLWMPTLQPGGPAINAKLDVANAPLLTGFLIQACDANKWLQVGSHMAALRQIKVFDPVWFELGLQTGTLLAMQVREQSTQTQTLRSR
jgi:hypothetical protein